MLVVLLCCMMKLVEMSAIASSPHYSAPVCAGGGASNVPPTVISADNSTGVVGRRRRKRRRYVRGSIADGKRLIIGNKGGKDIVATSKHFGGAAAMTGGVADAIAAGAASVNAPATSPADSDYNSNPHHHHQMLTNASCVSDDTSILQDVEFVQDNQDYQWFLDYGYRDNNHTSILSLAESYEAGDLGYYDTLAKNMDANLAEADIESFRTEDIHALLTNLPPMCTDQLSSQENNRQGESYASISNSLLGLHFSNSHNSSSNRSNRSNTSSQSLNQLNDNDYSTMSICKSELLFSPVKEVPEGGNLLLPLGGVNFSVDSLDCDDLMLTCQNTNMENYTIAFEGSGGGFDGEEEDVEWEEQRGEHGHQLNLATQHHNSTLPLHKSHVARLLKKHNKSNKLSLDSMTQSDSGNLTTWSKLRKLNRSEGKMERHPSGNNNQTIIDDSSSHTTALQFSGHLTGPTVKSQSMPNLYPNKTSSSNELGRIVAPSIMYLVNKSQLNTSDSSTECLTIKRKPVKVFNIQHQSTTSGTSGGSVLSEMATSVDGGSTSSAHSKAQAQQNFSLVKLFMKQKSISAEGMSTALDYQSSISENWNLSNSCNENKNSNFEDSLLQTNKYNSETSEIVNNKQQFIEKPAKLNNIDKPMTLNLNLNNNNSSLDISDYNTRKMQHQKLKSRSTNTKRNNKNISGNQTLSSDSSNSSFTNSSKLLQKHFPIHLMNKSIQTSTLVDSLTSITNKPTPYKLNGGCQTHQGHRKRDKFKVIEPSFLSKLKMEGEFEQSEKPVYVLYPNYVLPNLDFLNEKNDSTKVILLPQKTAHTPPSNRPPATRRPFSCNDLETLVKHGGGRNQFSHVRDWDSLLPLLPHEYQRVLAKVPEVYSSGGRKQSATMDRTGSCNSSSSGYRGSSTILSSDVSTPSSGTKFNPLFVYRYDSNTSSETSQTTHANVPPVLPKRLSLVSGGGRGEAVPPRPPLPRGILRRGNSGDVKMRPRYSMFEMTEEEFYSEIASKRRSLQEPYQGMVRNKRLSETEDEGVDAGTSSSSLDSNDHHFHQQNQPKNQHFNQQSTPYNDQPQNSILFANLNHEDLRQLEDFLQQSNITSNSASDNNNGSRSGSDQQGSREVISDELGMLELRSQVSRFLALRINNQCQENSGGRKVSFKGESEGRGPNNSPLNVSCTTTQRLPVTKQPSTLLVDMPDIHEESTPPTTSTPSSYQSSPRHTKRSSPSNIPSKLVSKQQHLITAVTDSVERVIHGFSTATNQPELDALGDSASNPNGAKVTLNRLCPALYAVLSDGLKGALETSFGPIGNSVWQVVEASAQQGPLTKALNDLVMKINTEDVITEGLVKFNAFVFGLLNVRSLDAWLSYLRTRESVLRKHYDQDALLVQALMGGTEVRQLLDGLIATVQPLALLPFQYDLLFEYRLLHESLKKMDTYQQQLSPTHQQFKSWKTDNTDPTTLPDLLNNSTSTTPPHLTVNVKHNASNCPPKVRPRSYVDNFRHTSGNSASATRCYEDGAFDSPNGIHGNQPRRWSGISANNKLFQAYSKLEGDEEYTDSLEEFSGEITCFNPNSVATSSNQPESLESNMSLNDEKPLNGRKFKKLQRRWEMLSCTNTSPPESPSMLPTQKDQDSNSPNLTQHSPSGNTGTAGKLSKIPRPVTSPVKPISSSNGASSGSSSSIPVMVSPQSAGKSASKKAVTSPGVTKKVGGTVVGMSPLKKPVAAPRTSRLDQLEQNMQETRTLTRPSSLPYKPHTSASKGSKITPPRRAISTSVNRKGATGTACANQSKLPKAVLVLPEIVENPDEIQMVVRTLSHRLPSESGHLPFNEGERLKVVLEVDAQWLLCCRGTQKGLVPRTAVISCDNAGPGSRF